MERRAASTASAAAQGAAQPQGRRPASPTGLADRLPLAPAGRPRSRGAAARGASCCRPGRCQHPGGEAQLRPTSSGVFARAGPITAAPGCSLGRGASSRWASSCSRPSRVLALGLLVLAAQPREASACTKDGYCGQGTCDGYNPGDPGADPPVAPTPGSCACKNGWTGSTTCYHPTGCDSSPCKHGGTCTATGGSHSCDCSGTGYTGDQSCNTPVPCGAAPSPPHTTGCSGGPKTFGQKCTATCDSGYTGGSSPSSAFTCGADGHFTGSLTCDAVSCGPAPSPPHSAGCSGPKTFDQTCIATCDSGYTGGPSTSSAFTCGADGHFTGSLTCDAVSCGAAPSPPHSAGCSGGPKTFGQTCIATCDSGYTGGYSTSSAFTCGADGLFMGSALTCGAVSCGEAPSPPHTSGCSGSKTFQQSCTAACDSGWTGGTSSHQFACGADGQYSGSLTCEKVSCGPSPSPPHSSGCGASYDFGGKCPASCDSGWTGGTKDATISCVADAEKTTGKYSGSLNCQKVSCGPSPSPPHSSGCGASYDFGGKCPASCDSGWTGGTKDATISCVADAEKTTGKYSGSLNCQKVSCGPSPSPPHSKGCGTLYEFDGECTALCDTGYTDGTKSAKFTCDVDGRNTAGNYSGSLTCKAVPCHDVTVPAHVNPPPPECKNMHYDVAGLTNKCTIQCAEGWTAGAKSEEFTCQAGGDIAGSLTCEKVQCGKPPGKLPTLTGHRTFDHSCAASSMAYQDHCKATCDVGYTGADFTSVCQANGREDAGQYNAEAAPCTACPAGKFKDKAGVSACTDCGKGKYNEHQTSIDKAACIDCPIGRFSNQMVLTEICSKCSAGQYQDHTMKTMCIGCQDHSDTKDASGSTKNDDCVCQAGWIANLGVAKCTACSSGQYKDTQGERGTPCKPCEANSDTSWPADQADKGTGRGHCVCNRGFGNISWAVGQPCQGPKPSRTLIMRNCTRFLI